MTMDGKNPRPLSELERELTEAESAFRAETASEQFVGVCDKLRRSSARLKAAEQAAALARKESGAPDPAESGDRLERAERASLGIPTIDDLRHAIFGGPKKKGGASGAAPEVNLALQLAEEEETRARNAFYLDLDRFTESARKLKKQAVRVVEAKKALEASQYGVPPTTSRADIEAEALGEMSRQPVLAGLDEFYVPR